ncbi:MAG: hypothetical protein KAW56_09770 [Candidatus Marinimicrobia bacterium]|nr:hypothetical protein [Candidatus Paceibacterota bacterium]MCK4447354.1 hypothetical protein [Candidatus Neomarinimicrobiota bacterium]
MNDSKISENKREVNLMNYWNIIWKRKKFIIVAVIIVTFVSVGVSLLLPKWYRATSVILSPSTEASPLGSMSILSNLGMGGMVGGNENIFRYLAILKSRALRESVVEKFVLQEHYSCESLEPALKKFDKKFEVRVGDENQVAISVLDKDQELVAHIVNYVVECLDSINIILSVANARSNRVFIESQFNQVLDSLRTTSTNSASFMKKKGILSLPDQVTIGVEKAADIQAEITYKEIELEVAKKSLSEDNPRINQIMYKIESLKEKYNEFFHGGDVRKLFPDFSEVPDLGVKLAEMQREVEYYSKLIEFLGPQYEQAKIEEAKTIPTLQILDKAVQPERKYKPKRSLIVIICAFLSLIISSSFVIIKENIKDQ